MRTFNIQVAKYFSGKTKLGEVLHKITSLNYDEIRMAAVRGAVWIQKSGKGKILRIRNSEFLVSPEDKVNFYYDPRVLSMDEISGAECIYECSHYGVWVKAAGVMPQGTQSSDHTSLLRYVEKIKKKDVYLIHRLDRETEGLMIIGYSSEAAAKLGELFQKNKIKKSYQAVVRGEIERGHKETINESLDGKEAVTHLESLENKDGKSLLIVSIDTGRLHQIRRHLEFIDHPVMGDPKYGRGNKNRDGLKLLAKSLNFIDPWTGQVIELSLETVLTL